MWSIVPTSETNGTRNETTYWCYLWQLYQMYKSNKGIKMVDGRYSECHAFIVIKRIDRQTVRHEFMPYLQHTMFSTPVNERKKTKQKRTHNTRTHKFHGRKEHWLWTQTNKENYTRKSLFVKMELYSFRYAYVARKYLGFIMKIRFDLLQSIFVCCQWFTC